MKKLMEWLAPLQRYAEKPWYLPVIALLAALDFFIVVIPTDALLVIAVLLRPDRWKRSFFMITTGSALGALALAALIQWDNQILTHPWLHHLFQSGTWAKTEEYVGTHGIWSLAVLAFSPAPQQPGVIIAALAKMPLVNIFLGVWIGRAVKYVLYAWCAAYAPKALARLSVGKEAVDTLQKHQKNAPLSTEES